MLRPQRIYDLAVRYRRPDVFRLSSFVVGRPMGSVQTTLLIAACLAVFGCGRTELLATWGAADGVGDPAAVQGAGATGATRTRGGGVQAGGTGAAADGGTAGVHAGGAAGADPGGTAGAQAGGAAGAQAGGAAGAELGGAGGAITLQSLAVVPTEPQVLLGTNQQFAALGTYSDGMMRELTEQVAWTSSEPLVATISNVVGSKGLATSAQPGTTSITAALSDKHDSTTLTVIPGVQWFVSRRLCEDMEWGCGGGMCKGELSNVDEQLLAADGNVVEVQGHAADTGGWDAIYVDVFAPSRATDQQLVITLFSRRSSYSFDVQLDLDGDGVLFCETPDEKLHTLAPDAYEVTTVQLGLSQVIQSPGIYHFVVLPGQAGSMYALDQVVVVDE